MGEAGKRAARGVTRITERNGGPAAFAVCHPATGSGGASAFSAGVLWTWGITGSTGYALATGIPVIHADSDLDLLIRAPRPISPDAFTAWQTQLGRALCRADTQVDTPDGGFALAEWLRDGKTLLKTSRGPRLVADPWRREE